MGLFNFFRTKKEESKLPENENIFSFLDPNITELIHCQIGEKVKLFRNPGNTEVRIYRTGITPKEGRFLIMEEGFLGVVPRNISEKIIKHLDTGGEYEARIIGGDKKDFRRIHIKFMPLKEIRRRIEHRDEGRRALLQKPFNPKKPFKIRIDKREYAVFPQGTKLIFHFRPPEEYLNNVYDLSVEITSTDEKYAFKYCSDFKTMSNLIRGNFTGYYFDIKIVKDEPYYTFCDVTPYKKVNGAY